MAQSTIPLLTTHRRRACIVGAGALIWCALSQAAYPARPVRVIVGFPPGSGTVMIARFVGNKLTDLIGGQVQIMFRTAAITLAQIRAGRMKPLGVSTRQRSALLPEVPTLAESGAPGYEMNTWWGVLGPAGMPAAVAARLNADIAAILGQADSVKRLEAEGAVPSPLPSAEFTRMLASEIEKWTRVARDANIKAE